jgi:hypothetical protein
MAWVQNATMHAWVWDAGPYLPGSAVRPRSPHHSLIAGLDCSEIDYAIAEGSIGAAALTWADVYRDPFIYTYDAGGVMAWQSYQDMDTSNGSLAAPTSPHLYLVFYNMANDDPSTYSPVVTDGMTLVPASYCTGGTAADPVPPANDEFADAILLPSTRSGSFDLPADMEWASVDSTEYDQLGTVFHYPWDGCTVWYKFVPPISGDYIFTVPNIGTFDPTDNPACWIYGYRESDHPGEHPATYDSLFSNNSAPDFDRRTCNLLGLVGGETIWLQVDMANAYSAHITWTGPAVPTWVVHPTFNAWVSYLGPYEGTEWPPRPMSLGDWPDDCQELDLMAIGKKTDGSVIAATAIQFSNNSNGSGGYVPSGDGYTYWSSDINVPPATKATYVRNNPSQALPANTQLYAVWYMPGYDAPDTTQPSRTPLECVTPEQIGDGTASVSPPPNDYFTDRIVLTGASGSFTVDNTDAWCEGKEWEGSYNNNAPDASWYEWTAPSSGLVAFTSTITSIANPDWETDLLLSIFDDLGTDVSPGYDGNQIAYSGNDVNNYDTATFTAVAGHTYYLMVESGDLTTGGFSWLYPVPPPNDNYADRIALTGDSGTATVDLTYATVEVGEPPDSGSFVHRTAWYSWIPTTTETIRWSVDRIAGTPRHMLRIYTDTGVMPTSGDELAETNAAGTMHLDVVAGTNYIIRIEMLNNGGRRPIDIHWLPYVPLDANADFSTAIVLSGATGSINFDSSDYAAHYHYYLYTPPTDCVLSIWMDQHFEPNMSGPDDPYGTVTVKASEFGIAQDHWAYDAHGGTVRAFELKGGNTYYVSTSQLSGYSGRLFWAVPTPQNNSFAAPANLGSGVRVFTSLFLGGQSLEAGESSPGVGTTVWATWTCPASGAYELAVREPWWPAGFQLLGHGPSRGLVARLGTGTSPASFTPLVTASSTTVDTALDADAVLNRVGRAFIAVANRTYHVQVDAMDPGGALAAIVIKPLAPPPPNDEPSAPVEVVGTTGSVGPFSTVNATISNESLGYPYNTYRDTDDPNSQGTTWYRFVGPPDVDDNVQGSTVFSFVDKQAGELTNWTIWIENQAEVDAGYDITTAPGMANLWQVGGYGSRFQFRPVAGQVYWISLTSRDAAAVTLHWYPGTSYQRGPWIERPVELAPAPYVAVLGGSRRGAWDQDQSFYNYSNGQFAYSIPFARSCAMSHARHGEVGGFSEFGNPTSGFDTICYPLGTPNAAWDGFLRCGLEESWDEGGFFLPAFYTLTVEQARWQLDFFYALAGPPTPPTPPLGSINQTEGVLHYSDQFPSSYSVSNLDEVPFYTLKQYDLQLSSFSVRADTAWTLSVRDATAMAAIDRTIQFAYLQPGEESALPLLASQTVTGTPGAAVADFTVTHTITDVTTYKDAIYRHPCAAVAAFCSAATASDPPAPVRALSTHGQAQRAYFNAAAVNVYRQPPRYRVLTPYPPDITAAPGTTAVKYVPVHQ